MTRPRQPRHRPIVARIGSAHLGDLSFIKACLTAECVRMPREVGEEAGSSVAKAAVRVYEEAVERGAEVEGSPESPGPVLRRSFYRYLTYRKRILDDWLPLAQLGHAPRSATCPVCGERAKLLLACLRVPGAGPRRIRSCPSCCLLADEPASSDFSFTLSTGTEVRLVGDIPRRRWAAGVLLRSSYPKEDTSWEWPADSAGNPVEVFRPPGPWPPGPLNLSLVFLWNCQVAILSHVMTRANLPP